MNDSKERALAHYDNMKAESHTGMMLKVGALDVCYEWHPKTPEKDIHTIVRVAEGDFFFELPGNWHAPFIIELAVRSYVAALHRQAFYPIPFEAMGRIFALTKFPQFVIEGKTP